MTDNHIQTGDRAPDFTALDPGLNPVSLKDFAGKVVVISFVPSLDTPVCDLQTRRFNAEAEALGDAVQILILSMDLRFVQARWCGAASTKRLKTLFDHCDAAFGLAYGLLINELCLLARTVLVIDHTGKVAYVQLVNGVSQEPDYDDALKALL